MSDLVNIVTRHVKYRFSKLYDFYRYICQHYPDTVNYKFPEKRWFFSHSPDTVKQRVQGIKDWFANIIIIEDLFYDSYFTNMFIT